jgi:ATP-binding cassette, subfamily B, bacterial PglK
VLATVRQTFDLIGREHPRRWAALVVLALFVSGFEIVGALLVYVLLALVVDPSGALSLPVIGDVRALFPDVEERTLLLATVGAMAAFFAVRGFVRVGATYGQMRIAHNAGARLSNRIIEGYLRCPYALHLQRPSAELIRNGHQAVVDMVDNLAIPMVRMAAESVLVITMLVVLTLIAPGATGLAVLVVGGAAGLLLLVVQPRLKTLGAVHHEATMGTLASAQQALHGVRDIKVLGREAEFAQRYGRHRLRMARARYLLYTAAQLPTIVIETALLAFILAFFGIALLRGTPAENTLSILGLFAYVGFRLQPSLRDIVGGLNSIRFASTPLQDVHADLVTIQRLAEPADKPAPLPFREALEAEGVCFRYERAETDALRRINLTIRPGEQIGICGPTGGGKTTLIDVLTGLLEPTGGRVAVDGVDVHAHPRAWRRSLGVVPQMVFLTDDTLRRNIALGVPDEDIDDEAVAEAVGLAQLGPFIASLPRGLDTSVGERGVRISGGQRQRIAIARALYTRPSVLVFDEGTSALDNLTEEHLMSAIERLRGDHTIILVAHRLSTVQNCDRVVFLEGGLISGLGSYDDLAVSHPGFRAMAGTQ